MVILSLVILAFGLPRLIAFFIYFLLNGRSSSPSQTKSPLSGATKEQFWLTYKEINTSCVNWQNVIDEDTNVIVTKFDQQLIIDFIDDFHLKLLTD